MKELMTMEEARKTYRTLLQLPFGSLRIQLQGNFCECRDRIAELTGRGAEEIQNEFESQAQRAQTMLTATYG